MGPRCPGWVGRTFQHLASWARCELSMPQHLSSAINAIEGTGNPTNGLSCKRPINRWQTALSSHPLPPARLVPLAGSPLKICFCLPSQAAFCWAQRPGGLVHRSYSSKPPEAAGKLYSKNFLQGRHVRSALGVASLQSNVELKENLKIAAEAEGATETERCRKQTPTVEQEVRLSTPQHFRPKNIRSHSSR